MINTFKKNSDIICISLVFLVAGLLLFFFVNNSTQLLTAIIATGISLSLGIRQYRTENDKLFKQLFTEFNTKYDSKFNDRLDKIVEKFRQDKSYELRSKDKTLIVDYLNFCAEEYLWYTKDRIPKEVWQSWENGMMYYLNNPKINTVVNNEKGQKDSYYGLFEKIKDRLHPFKE